MTTTPGTLPAETTVGRVALTVSDLASLRSFYRDVIGLRVLSEDEDRVVLGADEARIVLREDATAPKRPRSSAGLYHLAIRVPSRDALGAALERIRADWSLEGASDHAVSEALYLSDPEGNGVEVYCDRPRRDWPIAGDGSVEMITERLDLADLAAASDGSASAPSGTDLGHVHLEVTDLEEARAFYVDGIGLGVRQSMGGSALFLAAGDYHHHVGLNTWGRRSTENEGRGLDWFELVVPDGETLDDARPRLEDRGSTLERDSGSLEVADPDGITIRLRTED